MKKKLLFFILLIIIDLAGFYYVYQNIKLKKAYVITEIQEAILLNIKELSFETFEFEDYFYTKHIKNYNYQFEDNLEIKYVDFHNQNHIKVYQYHKIEPKIEEEVPIIEESKPIHNESIVEEVIQEQEEIELYFEGYHDITIQIDAPIDELVNRLLKDIKTNQNVSLNYANVNLSSKGVYPVYYYVNDQTYTINVTVD